MPSVQTQLGIPFVPNDPDPEPPEPSECSKSKESAATSRSRTTGVGQGTAISRRVLRLLQYQVSRFHSSIVA